MGRRPLAILLTTCAAVAASLVPTTGALAAMSVTGTVSSPSGEVQSGTVLVYEEYFDEDTGSTRYHFVTSAEVTDGEYAVEVEEEGRYTLHFAIRTQSDDGGFTFVSFNTEADFEGGAASVSTAPVSQIPVHLVDAAGEPASARVSLACDALEVPDGLPPSSSSSATPGIVAGTASLYGIGSASCSLEATYDGITKREPAEYDEETGELVMVLDSHVVSGDLDIPVGNASEVQVVASDDGGVVAATTVPSSATSYSFAVPPGQLELSVTAQGFDGPATFHRFQAFASADVSTDLDVDFTAPSAPVDITVRDDAGPREQLVTLSCASASERWSLDAETVGSRVLLAGLPTVGTVSCTLYVAAADRSEHLLTVPVDLQPSVTNFLTVDLDSEEVTYSGDADGVDDAVEEQGPNGGDGNNDGTPDAEQGHVATLPRSAGSPSPDPGSWVTLAGPAGSTLEDVTTSDPSGLPAPPPGVTLPAGLVSFRLTGITPGSTQTVDVHTPGTAAVLDYAKLDDGAWSLLPRSRVVGAPGLTSISLTDGEVGDADGVANGVIVDPGGIASMTSGYRFDGFLNPINDPALMPSAPMSVFKRNSTVPVSFVLRNASGQVVTTSAPPEWLTPARLTTTSAGVNEEPITVPVTSDGEFDLRGDRWQYNWSTKGLTAGYTYKIGARLDDGSVHHVIVALR